MRTILVPAVSLFTVLIAIGASGRAAVNTQKLSEAVDKIATSYFPEKEPGCAVGVIYQGQYVHKAGYGLANLEHGVPITSESVFRIGSTSKQITAMSIALLAERGVLDLDADVHTYLPDLKDYGQAVTVRQIVHHIGGMGDYDHKVFTKPNGEHFRFGNQDFWTIEEFYREVAKADLVLEPGTKFKYSNLGYFLLSMVVEKVSGETLRDFAQREIFDKLKMDRTFFNDNVNGVVPHRVDGYQQMEDGSYEILMTNLSWVGDGGIYTSLDDFIAWDQNYYHNVLGEGGQGLIELVETPHPTTMTDKNDVELPVLAGDSPMMGYGYGLMIDEYRGLRRVQHNGGWVGFRAGYQRYPEKSLSLVSFCNTPRETLQEFWDKVVDLYLDALQ